MPDTAILTATGIYAAGEEKRNTGQFWGQESKRIKPILVEEAKKRMTAGKADPVPISARGGTGKVRDELAKIAGVGPLGLVGVIHLWASKSKALSETFRKTKRGYYGFT